MSLLKRIIRAFRMLIPGKKVMDSSIITSKLYTHVTYVNAEGVLCFQAKTVVGEVIGVTEWPEAMKRAYQVDLSTTVIDILINPIEYTE